MFDIKRRYQNVENLLNDQNGARFADEATIRQEKITHIKHNVKNLHILAYFVIAILVCLYAFRLISNHSSDTSPEISLKDVANKAIVSDPFASIYNLDLSYFTGVMKDNLKRNSQSDLPGQLDSGNICDLRRFFLHEATKAKFISDYRNKKAVLFYGDVLNDWVHPNAWQYSNLNSTFKDTIVQFGRSVDSDFELRETTFSNFLKNLIGQTDLRGEPWQIRDSQILSSNRKSLLKTKTFFPDEWNSAKSDLQLGTTLSSTGFKMSPSGPTMVGVVKGRTRLFVYPTSVTPPAGYEHDVDMLSWFQLIYPKLRRDDENRPMECILEKGDIVHIPEAWFWGSINIGTTTKVVFYGHQPTTELGQKLAYLNTLDSTETQPGQLMKLWEEVETLLPKSEFVQFEKGRVLARMGKHEEALQIFQSLDRFFIMAQVEVARLVNQVKGDWEKAVRILNDTTELVPRSDTVLRELAFLHHEKENFNQAGDFFRNAALLSSQIEQQIEDLDHAFENFAMLPSCSETENKKKQIESLKLHFKAIAHNEYTAFRN